ncbi:MAG: hypothetical protein N3A72_05535 [bacterium]|nr:hypothetical protein [bacterium]
MASYKYRFQMYKELHKQIPQIYAEAKKFADDIGLPPTLKGKIGLTGAVSSCHGLLSREVKEAMDKASRQVIENKFLAEEIRELVKDVYGDEYDAAAINTCEAALWVTFDCLASPPMQGRGDNYQARYIALYERHLHHQGAYGRPFPPRYKDIFADRGVTAGELGFYGKRLENLSTVIVPLVGAKYPVHGIKGYPVILLSQVNAQASLEKIEDVAELNSCYLTAITSLGYDTVGYGYGTKDKNGTPELQKGLSVIAREFNVPYIIDNAWGIPFIGADIRKLGGDVMVYSMDKASGAPTVGLIIGKEDSMVPIRRALGMHSDRSGAGFAYGKAAYVTNDPGKEALVGLIATLKILRDKPKMITDPVDKLFEIVKQEFSNIPAKFQPDLLINKTYNSAAVEINYERTWKDNQMGIPIFSIEDMYAGTNILQSGLAQMGIIPTIGYDANIFISLGLGTLDEEGNLLENETRIIVRALVGLINIICKYAGVV